MIATIGLLSFAASVVFTETHPSAAFYLMPLRMWELLLGAGLLFVPALPALCGSVGLAVILASAVWYTTSTPFPGFAALAPCVGGALVILSGSRLLSTRPFVYIGKCSYSIYLWHWPLWVYTHSSALTILFSLGIGALSYEWIETPIRTGRWIPESRRLAFVCAGVEALICIAGLATNAVASRHEDVKMLEAHPPPEAWAPRSSICRAIGCPGAPSFVLWGDSHAVPLIKVCDELCKKHQVSGQCFVCGAIPPMLDVWIARTQDRDTQVQWNRHVVDWTVDHNVQSVLIVGRWEARVPRWAASLAKIEENTESDRMLRDQSTKELSMADSLRVFEQGLDRTLKALAGRRVYWLRQPPVQTGKPVTEDDYEFQQQAINEVLHSRSLLVIGPGRWFRDGVSLIGDEAGPYYRDHDHANAHGARTLIAPVLEPVFQSLKRQITRR
jgi:hypothetical protein